MRRAGGEADAHESAGAVVPEQATERHLQILSEICERYIFVHKDAERVSRLQYAASLPELCHDARVRSYLGALAPNASGYNLA